VRHLVHDETNADWLMQPAVLESLQILADHKIPYEIVGVKASHLKATIHIAQTIPHLSIMLDHLLNPPISDVSLFPEWESLMKHLNRTFQLIKCYHKLKCTYTPNFAWESY
jgi:L-fuconolactonase